MKRITNKEYIEKSITNPINLLYKIIFKIELLLMFYLKNGYKLDLKNLVTYNEKIIWMKLYYRKDIMPVCADKYTVRDYIKSKGYEKFLPRLLWQGHDAEIILTVLLPYLFGIETTRLLNFPQCN